MYYDVILVLLKGCPYSYEKIEGHSHPFGRNISGVNTAESCKLWCLTRYDHIRQHVCVCVRVCVCVWVYACAV